MEIPFTHNLLINRSGGISYHRRALFYGHLWRHHRFAVNEWLGNWPITSEHLILVGPSFGYSLPETFLRSFDRISFFELDPLVRVLGRLLPKSHRWQSLGPWQPKLRFELAERFKNSQWLFCNLLGQLALSPQYESEKDNLNRLFHQNYSAINWASFHDLWSASESPDDLGPWQAPANTILEESVRHFYRGKIPRSPILDHQTDEFLPKIERRQWIWQITPSRYHCIEGVRSSMQVRGA